MTVSSAKWQWCGSDGCCAKQCAPCQRPPRPRPLPHAPSRARILMSSSAFVTLHAPPRHVCMYIRTCMCIRTYAMYVCTYARVYLLHVCMYIRTCMCIRTYAMYVCTYVRMYLLHAIYVWTYVRVYAYVCMRVRVCVYVCVISV